MDSSGYPYGISDVRIFVPAKFELASREALLTNDLSSQLGRNGEDHNPELM
jgi:hypothetical protein